MLAWYVAGQRSVLYIKSLCVCVCVCVCACVCKIIELRANFQSPALKIDLENLVFSYSFLATTLKLSRYALWTIIIIEKDSSLRIWFRPLECLKSIFQISDINIQHFLTKQILNLQIVL